MKHLFDPSRNIYAFRINTHNWGNGPIMDETGSIIGKYYKDKEGYANHAIIVQELDDEIRIQTQRKGKLRWILEIIDENNQIIGRVRKNKYNTYYLEDSEGIKLIECSTQFYEVMRDFEDSSGNLIAKVYHTKKWPEIFQDIVFQFGDTFAIIIKDTSFNKKLLIGLIFAITYQL